MEVYRGKQKAEINLITYATYVMFFPQLVAGPIERPNISSISSTSAMNSIMKESPAVLSGSPWAYSRSS